MNIFTAFLMGALQGLTEFIPISSTAHLLILQKILAIPADDFSFSFLVIIQLGTILSLIVFFWKDICQIVKSLLAMPFSNPDNTLAWNIIISTIPALVAGFFLKDLVENLFKTPLLEAGVRLLISAILLALAEWLGRKNRDLPSMKWLDALVVGITQVIAVFPGASRSGTTISAGLFLGFNRKSAARFAFLMSLPVMLAAGGYQLLDVFRLSDLVSFIPLLLMGFFTAAIIGWFVIKWLLNFLSNHTLYYFSIYCLIAGSIVLFIHFA